MVKTYQLYLRDARGVEHTLIEFNYGGYIERIEIYSEAAFDWIQVVEPLHLEENKAQLFAWESLKRNCQSAVDTFLYDRQWDLDHGFDTHEERLGIK